jgi:hypothetical protein
MPCCRLRWMRRSACRSGPLALLLLAGCERPVPAVPTFDVDVRPIFEASCGRCHGAGGTLNADPRAIEDAPPNESNLDQYDDSADCAPTPQGTPLTCVRGAAHEATNGNLKAYLHGAVTPLMPLPPSDPLGTWELAVIDNWVAESPPLR